MSQGFAEAGLSHIVCVATDYGEEVMSPHPIVEIRKGRMDAEAMEQFFREQKPGRVFDATHPFAQEASENIKTACKAAAVDYVRIVRNGLKGDFGNGVETEGLPGEEEITSEEGEKNAVKIRWFSDIRSCEKALHLTTGNILLTTGSKDLSVFASNESVRSRLYVRVLPSAQSILLCEKAGLLGKQIIAMHGPFSSELNEVLIRQYNIKILVSKESGRTGGFEEKVKAAKGTDVELYVVRKPKQDVGLSVEEALWRYGGESSLNGEKSHQNIVLDGNRTGRNVLYLIGCGPGSKKSLTQEAIEAIGECDLIFGAKRLVAEFPEKESYPFYLFEDILPILLEKHPQKSAILFSGDSGFFSGAQQFWRKFAESQNNRHFSFQIILLPGISSISYMSAKIGIPWSNAPCLSVHGRSAEEAVFWEITEKVRTHPAVFVLVSGTGDVQKLAKILCQAGLPDCTLHLGFQLSYEDESIHTISAAEYARPESKGEQVAGLCTVLIENKHPEKKRLLPLQSDSNFLREKVPMTKEMVRHAILFRLHLMEHDVFYDVGSGTGSVAIEAAGLSTSLSVFAIERNHTAVDLIRANLRHLGVGNVCVVEGEAPEVFSSLPAPSCVFVGGSGGRLRDILQAVYDRNACASVVISAVSLETLAEFSELQTIFSIEEVVVEQISVANAKALGDYHLMQAQNPVWVMSFRFAG